MDNLIYISDDIISFFFTTSLLELYANLACRMILVISNDVMFFSIPYYAMVSKSFFLMHICLNHG